MQPIQGGAAMYLTIDGKKIQANPGQSLLDLIQELGLNGNSLCDKPLAAKIAGEVFTLNYIPVRETDACADHPLVRRAMEASNGEVRLLYYGDEMGKECYLRTAWFVIFLALRQLWPSAVSKMNCTLGSSVYIEVKGAEDFSVSRLKQRIAELVMEDIPLIRRRVSREDAMQRYSADGQPDKARLLRWRKLDYFDEYFHEDFADYYYGEMMPSTSWLTVWDVVAADGGFVFVYPDDRNPDVLANLLNICNVSTY